MIAFRPISSATVFVPTPDAITNACAKYRAGWSPSEHDARLTDGINAQVWLLAEIMRPMAVEAGLILAPVAEVIPEAEPTASPTASCDSAA